MDDLAAVIFDMDGVLIDSEPFWRRAQIRVFGELGLDLSPADTDQTMGVRINEVVRFWFERRPWKGPAENEVAESIVDEVIRLVRTEGGPMPGVESALEVVDSLEVPLGLATSSSERLIKAILGTLNLEEVFEVVCSAANEKHGKPHPDVFLTAARKLGVQAGNCLVIEDSAYGVQAGKAAGMSVIAVPAPYQFDHPEFDRADLKLASLEELSVETVKRAIT